MMFKDKLDRAQRWSRKRRVEIDGIEATDESINAEDLPTDAELRAEGQKIELEKGDLKAMMLAGFLTIFPVCVLVLLLFALVAYLFSGGF